MKTILTHADNNRQMEENGYVTFPLLPKKSCHALHDFYTAYPYKHEERGVGFYTGMDQANTAHIIHGAKRIWDEVSPLISQYLQDFQVITATFVVKDKGTHNITPIHQDWTFVDEAQYNSYTLWCPLQDMTLENGPLGLLPGSHKLLDHAVRPSPSPPYVPVFKECMMELFGYLDFLPVPAGQAILFDHRTWHGALPNASKHARVALGISLTHKAADLHHHYLLPGTKEVKIFAVDKTFFHTHSNKQLRSIHSENKEPNGYPCLSTYNWQAPAIGGPELLKQVQAHTTPNLSIMAKLAALFPPQQPVTTEVVENIHKAETKPLWKIYTPKNIYMELKHRLAKHTPKMEEEEDAPATALQERAQSTQEDMAYVVGAFYDANHESFIETYGSVIQAFRTKEIEKLLDYELKSIGIKAGETVLDAGCGVCGPAMYFGTTVPCWIHAITISDRQYKQAARVLEAEKQRHIRLYHGDFHKPLDFFSKELFDRIFFLEAFGHSSQKKELLAACWEVLKPGGTLYIKDLFRRIAPTGLSQRQIDAHISHINAGYCYSVNELNVILDMARKQGYIVQFVKTLDIAPEHFEDLHISNHFQELTGINRTQDWNSYIFPVDFMELKLYKPIYGVDMEKDKYFLQQLLHANTKETVTNHA